MGAQGYAAGVRERFAYGCVYEESDMTWAGSVRYLAALAAVIIGLSATGAAPVAAASRPQPHLYLALGDSLAYGYQPDGVPSTSGYTYDIASTTGLKLTDLGCPGETTNTFIAGGICSYHPYPSQLAAAVKFLSSHRNRMALVTIDLGANNVDGCLSASGVSTTCVTNGLTQVESQLPFILAALRLAAGPKVPILAMNYYDPFLAIYWIGEETSSASALAAESVALDQVLSGIIQASATPSRVGVADVMDAFGTLDNTSTSCQPYLCPTPTAMVSNTDSLANGSTLPTSVAEVCDLTWMCTAAPNIHANDIGYALIASTFEATKGFPLTP